MYCVAADVKRYAGRKDAYNDSTDTPSTPTLAEVNSFIEEAGYDLDCELVAAGYEGVLPCDQAVDISTTYPRAARWLKKSCAIGAAAAAEIARTGQNAKDSTGRAKSLLDWYAARCKQLRTDAGLLAVTAPAGPLPNIANSPNADGTTPDAVTTMTDQL